VITGLDRGGAETMLFKLVQRTLAYADHIVVSLSGSGSLVRPLKELGIPVFTLDLKSNPVRLCALPRLIREYQPDIVHSWMYHSNLLAAFAVRMRSSRPRLVWGIRHTPRALSSYKFSTRWVIRLGSCLSRSADAILYNAVASRKRHHALGYSSRHDCVIPNGFDTRLFAPSSKQRAEVRRELGVSESALLVGLAARDHPIKGIDVLLDAIQHPSLRGLDLHLVMVGRGLDAKNPKLSSLLGMDHLSPAIHPLGERKNMHLLLPGLDVLVSPSRSEAFSNTIGEAMACGVPCVVTDVGDSALIVSDTGIVISPEDPDALAAAVADFAMLEPSARRAMAERARTRICSEFDLERISLQYVSLYERVLAS